ncbi:hypothetical protein RND71_024942 [Anisodus tanguticus]|uniref:SAGA-associated factor 11 n=1 Tax=Anisodus tanguticus TaxID=243964 RepID=A0AAE1RS03_9SOLA|nr:hypothetical protein RND71_024942 [Anisodus tanguticus]
MSAPNEDNVSQPQLSSHMFDELLDSIIIDVASECHRIAKLGLDRNLEEEEEELRLSAQARARVADPSNSSETNGKYIVDIFGQTHPPVANEIFECMNCGRSIMAGRFAPHLEKCMGKVIFFPISIRVSNYLISVDSNSFLLVLIFALGLRGGRPVLRQQEVALLRRGILEEVLLQPTLLVQIPPARVDYQVEVPVLQVMNTQMAP